MEQIKQFSYTWIPVGGEPIEVDVEKAKEAILLGDKIKLICKKSEAITALDQLKVDFPHNDGYFVVYPDTVGETTEYIIGKEYQLDDSPQLIQ